jgi:membrane protease YdiL (CAAX protease family)
VTKRAALIAGLAVAWGGPAFLLTPIGRRLGEVWGLVAMWALLAIMVAVVILWEKRPLASIGLRPFSWRSLGWGALLAALTIYATVPFLTWVLNKSGIPAFEAGMAKALELPLWLRALSAVTAGVVEDALFIGYAFTRLEMLAGNRWMAGIIAVSVFAFLHLPHWGIGPALAYLVAIGIAVAFFNWRRDLLANVFAHVLVDGLGLIFARTPAASGVFLGA